MNVGRHGSTRVGDACDLSPGGLFDLHGHVAVVTGGNGGIGLGMAAGLAGAHADVCIWGTNGDKTAQAVRDLDQLGDGAINGWDCDIGNEQAVTETMAKVVDRFGHLDSCFANAGVSGPLRPLLDTSLKDFHTVTAIDLDGTFVTVREAARHMVAGSSGGSLVVTSSLSVLMGAGRNYAYAASKAAVVALVKACAIELARHNIRANAVLPGWTESDLTRHAFESPRFVDGVMPRMPVRRWGRPQDFAAIAVYLASPASAFHTGDSILLDGGYAAF